MRHTRLYRDGVLEAKEFPAAQISDYLQEPGTVVWLDLCEPDRADLEVVSQEFGLHPLAVEDAVQQHERPHGAEVQRRSFELRKSLVVLRRLVLPMREVVNTLLRRDLGLVDAAMGPYFQDVYDHVLRATEWTESLRDLVSTILETNLTIQGNRLNSIMKKVTSWAAIIAVPTAVTGYYGMNVPTPGSAGTPACSPPPRLL
jgi:Mg2+ and Co2+ transporter CorA